MEESLKNERLQIRRFLERYGLVELTEGEQEAPTQCGKPPGDLPDIDKKPKPHSEARFRRIRIVASD
jgi:hypothetical protein